MEIEYIDSMKRAGWSGEIKWYCFCEHTLYVAMTQEFMELSLPYLELYILFSLIQWDHQAESEVESISMVVLTNS